MNKFFFNNNTVINLSKQYIQAKSEMKQMRTHQINAKTPTSITFYLQHRCLVLYLQKCCMNVLGRIVQLPSNRVLVIGRRSGDVKAYRRVREVRPLYLGKGSYRTAQYGGTKSGGREGLGDRWSGGGDVCTVAK